MKHAYRIFLMAVYGTSLLLSVHVWAGESEQNQLITEQVGEIIRDLVGFIEQTSPKEKLDGLYQEHQSSSSLFKAIGLEKMAKKDPGLEGIFKDLKSQESSKVFTYLAIQELLESFKTIPLSNAELYDKFQKMTSQEKNNLVQAAYMRMAIQVPASMAKIQAVTHLLASSGTSEEQGDAEAGDDMGANAERSSMQFDLPWKIITSYQLNELVVQLMKTGKRGSFLKFWESVATLLPVSEADAKSASSIAELEIEKFHTDLKSHLLQADQTPGIIVGDASALETDLDRGCDHMVTNHWMQYFQEYAQGGSPDLTSVATMNAQCRKAVAAFKERAKKIAKGEVLVQMKALVEPPFVIKKRFIETVLGVDAKNHQRVIGQAEQK